ncbi:SCP2 sterol-binding domain-containing protein [Litorivicinus sp.]|nr:SCP2 sterol-binding domain-containing protein [Litorivicinus sp.]
MISRVILASLVSASEKAISLGMSAAEISKNDLVPMVGKVLKLHVTDMNLEIWIVCGEERWWLSTESQGSPDVELLGDLGSLVDTARTMTKANTPLVLEGLDIRGNVGVLQTMQGMLQSIDLNWEDMATKTLGPLQASILIRTLRGAREQWLVSRDSLKRQAEDFLRAEQATILTEDHYLKTTARILKLSRNAERLVSRLKRLEVHNG